MNSQTSFTSRFEIDDNCRIVIVSLTGDLDPSAVGDLHPQIQELIRADYRHFIFDLTGLEHLGSLALRLFVALTIQLKRKGDVAFYGLSDRIASLFEMTNVTRLLRAYPSRDLAMAALRNAGFRRASVAARRRPTSPAASARQR